MAAQCPVCPKPDKDWRFMSTRTSRRADQVLRPFAGAFHMAHTLDEKLPLRRWEQFAATILVSIVALGGAGMLYKLQGHLHPTRLLVDPSDEEAWKRGLEVVRGLVFVLIAGAIAVCYSFWRA